MKIKYLNFYINMTKFLEVIAFQEALSRGFMDTLDPKLFPQVFYRWQIAWLQATTFLLGKETALI